MSVCLSLCVSTDTAMQQQQHRLHWVESVLLLQLCGGGKFQRHTAGLAVSSAAFSVRYQYQCELSVDA